MLERLTLPPAPSNRSLGAVDLILPLGVAAAVRMTLVLAFLGTKNEDIGATMEEFVAATPAFSLDEAKAGIAALTEAGEVFTTVDENTFAALQ